MENMKGSGYGKFFTLRTNSYWNNLLREVANSPTLDTDKIQLDRMMGHLVYAVFFPIKTEPDDP